jgi:hypothetical protein
MLICCAAGLIAQTGREAYRQAYDVWRQAHGDLERDAGTGGPAQVAQADRAAAAAASFEAARIAHLKSSAEEAAQRRQLVFQNSPTRPSADVAPEATAGVVASGLQTVTRAIARFAGDKDRGIQQLRQSLERERVALVALSDSIQANQKSVAATSAAAAALDEASAKTKEAFGDQAAQLSQSVTQLEKESAAWADYYQQLARAIQVANAPPPPVNVISAAPRNDALPRVPLPRFVGAWTYPMSNGIFHGAQPEFVDLVVHEQNGHADGTLYGRFKPPPGSAIDPVVRFDFQGDFSGTAMQKFTLVTTDGAQGTLELIPGPAFNLLEVNFQTEPKVNKIRAANFILVKK